MKPQTKKRQAIPSPHLPPPPNERAGISPVTVRRIMADLEYNYYQDRKSQSFTRGEELGGLPPGGPAR